MLRKVRRSVLKCIITSPSSQVSYRVSERQIQQWRNFKADLSLFEQRLNLCFQELSYFIWLPFPLKQIVVGVSGMLLLFLSFYVGTFFTLLVSEALLNADYCSLAGIRHRVSVSFCFCHDCSLTCID